MPIASRPSRPLLAAAGLVAAVVAAYAVALHGGFLWDDDLHITANPTIIGPLGLKEIWTSARANYFPLVLTNFWLQHALWGLDPFGYHVVTLGCHAGAAVLLWRVLRRLRVPGAWVGAALWALHPVQVESVAWICELKNTQSAVFFLGSILCFLRALAASSPAERTMAHVLALAAALLALLSKSSTVMLPVALLLCAWWQGARLDRRLFLALLPFFAFAAVAAGWTIWEQKVHSGAAGAEWSQSGPERMALAGRVVWFYLGKLAWPAPLAFIYPRWTVAVGQPLAFLPLGLALAGLFGAWRCRQRPSVRAVLFAALFFVALLFPVLGFFDVFFFRYSYVGDHFQYLASMGPLALLGAGLAIAGPRRAPWIFTPLLAALGTLTAAQCRDYHDTATLWRATLARNPGATMAWVNLGDTLAQQGRYDDALTCFNRSLALKPGMADVHNDIGCTLVLAHRVADAVPQFERSLALQPDNAEAHNNLGNALRLLHRSDDAVAHYRRALALKPDYAEAHNNLGAELAERGASAEAIAHFEAALRLNPRAADAHDNLGQALRRLGRLDEAVAQYRAALALRPDFAEAHASLGQALLARGALDEALTHLRRAVALKPEFAEAQGYLGRGLALAGNAEEALGHFRRAAALAPDSAEARNNLGTALAQRGQMREALAEFEAAVRASSAFAPARVNLGMAFAAQRRWHEAAVQFERAVALEPDSSEGHARLAVALVNSGELARAVPEFEAALRLNPDAPELRANLDRVLQALGRGSDALDHRDTAGARPAPPR